MTILGTKNELVRFSYLNCFEAKETPSGKLKYSACIMIPKTAKSILRIIQEAIDEATAKGISSNKFSKKDASKGSFRTPLRDGDTEHDNGDRGAEFKGMYFLNASSDNQPDVVGKNPKVPIIDANEAFSGCWGRVDVNFFPYHAAGNKGVGVGLNNIQIVKEDERLDGRVKAEDAFAAYADEGEELT
jgi:hypothetical protein